MTTHMYYEAASGHDNQAGLTKLIPQPKTANIKHPAFIVDGNLAGDFDGSLFVDFEWSGALQPSDWSTILGDFGLSDTVSSNPATITALKQDRSTWQHYNCTAYIMEPDWAFKMTTAKIRCVALVAVS